jgi:hypothetical protein
MQYYRMLLTQASLDTSPVIEGSLWAFVLPLHVAHLAFSWLMLGVVLTAQRVMYPGFALKDPERFAAAMQHHQTSIGFIVAPSMLLEGAAACTLLVIAFISKGGYGLSIPIAACNVACLAACWVYTFAHIVPLHMKLTRSDASVRAELIQTLVSHHWLRTIVWSSHAMLAAWMAWCSASLLIGSQS